jgi:hypothetical protein
MTASMSHGVDNLYAPGDEPIKALDPQIHNNGMFHFLQSMVKSMDTENM